VSDICLLGVTYPGLAPFIDDYLDSLSNQTFTDFTILLANDGFKQLSHFLKKHSLKARVRVIEMNGTPTSIRTNLLVEAQNTEANYFIFSDCDDALQENRVEESRSLMERYDIVVNDLCVTDENLNITFPNYFSKRIDDRKELEMLDLIDLNFMGLTNTSCSRKVLQVSRFISNYDVIAFDWLYWSLALSLNYSAVFTCRTSTKYRTYNKNIAGLPQNVNQDSVEFGLRVKRLHYKALSRIDSSNEVFSKRLLQVEEMINYKNKQYIYENMIENMNKYYPLWWENIRLIDFSRN
jgi:glycosyltransferase involved in cell wall biosynthesis